MCQISKWQTLNFSVLWSDISGLACDDGPLDSTWREVLFHSSEYVWHIDRGSHHLSSLWDSGHFHRVGGCFLHYRHNHSSLVRLLAGLGIQHSGWKSVHHRRGKGLHLNSSWWSREWRGKAFGPLEINLHIEAFLGLDDYRFLQHLGIAYPFE